MSGGRGKDWTQQQVERAVEEYFDIRALQEAGQTVNKRQRHIKLGAEIGRVAGAIEQKFCNISSILCELGIEPSRGYPRRDNFQGLLAAAVERHLSSVDGREVVAIAVPVQPEPPLEIGDIPDFDRKQRKFSEEMKHLVRKFDPAARDARNRALGRLGEQKVLEYERSKLVGFGRDDLAEQVRWVSEMDGDGAGFDIQSFDRCGDKRYLEVKTTNGSSTTPFYLSENEFRFSKANPEGYRLVRLYNFSAAPKAFVLRSPIEQLVELQPAVYRASLI